ncbi:hypothetical protein OROGR_011736 [Orobanche gracilis]
MLCVESEEKLRRLLHNVSYLLNLGGYFLGFTPDPSTVLLNITLRFECASWVLFSLYQKNVEGCHSKGGGTKTNIFPSSIRSEGYRSLSKLSKRTVERHLLLVLSAGYLTQESWARCSCPYRFIRASTAPALVRRLISVVWY